MNDPNLLAFKGTPGPWKVQISQSGKHNFNITSTTLGVKFKIARIPFIIEDDKDDEFLTKLNQKVFQRPKQMPTLSAPPRRR